MQNVLKTHLLTIVRTERKIARKSHVLIQLPMDLEALKEVSPIKYLTSLFVIGEKLISRENEKLWLNFKENETHAFQIGKEGIEEVFGNKALSEFKYMQLSAKVGDARRDSLEVLEPTLVDEADLASFEKVFTYYDKDLYQLYAELASD